MNLRTETQLAEELSITVERAAELRRRNNWPHVRLTRFDVRYTDLQVEQIIASQSVTPKRDSDVAKIAAGQSRRSAAKKAS